MAIKEIEGIDKIEAVLGDHSQYLLAHKCCYHKQGRPVSSWSKLHR